MPCLWFRLGAAVAEATSLINNLSVIADNKAHDATLIVSDKDTEKHKDRDTCTVHTCSKQYNVTSGCAHFSQISLNLKLFFNLAILIFKITNNYIIKFLYSLFSFSFC